MRCGGYVWCTRPSIFDYKPITVPSAICRYFNHRHLILHAAYHRYVTINVIQLKFILLICIQNYYYLTSYIPYNRTPAKRRVCCVRVFAVIIFSPPPRSVKVNNNENNSNNNNTIQISDNDRKLRTNRNSIIYS